MLAVFVSQCGWQYDDFTPTFDCGRLQRVVVGWANDGGRNYLAVRTIGTALGLTVGSAFFVSDNNSGTMAGNCDLSPAIPETGPVDCNQIFTLTARVQIDMVDDDSVVLCSYPAGSTVTLTPTP